MSHLGRGTEGAPNFADRRMYLWGLLLDLERLQPDLWARWAADGSPVLFRRLWADFGCGRIMHTIALSARHGRDRITWQDGADRGALTVKLLATLDPDAGLVWRWICPWTGFLCRAFDLSDPDLGPADGAA